MPTVLRFEGLHVVIYPNDHRPAHVHIIGAGKEAMFLLHCPDGPPELYASYGVSLRDANRIGEVLNGSLDAICAKWREIHGCY